VERSNSSETTEEKEEATIRNNNKPAGGCARILGQLGTAYFDNTFNRRFDVVFGNDCKDTAGKLKYLEHGSHGIDLVCTYLENLNLAGLPGMDPRRCY
jgi:hypothetical protein